MAWTWDRRTGKKVYKTFSGRGAKSEAKGWRADAVGQVRRGTLRPPTRKTVRDAWADFVAAIERGEVLSRYRRPYAPSALRGYRSDFKRYIDPDLGGARLDDVRRGDVQALVERLNGKGLSGSKVRNVIVPLQALYRWADRRDMVTIDPTVNLELPEQGGSRDWTGTTANAKALLDALPDEERAPWAAALYAGLRRGELRALRVSNLRGLDGKGVAAISVEHGWDDKEGERDTKSTAGVRDVPMPETLRAILAAHVERLKLTDSDLVFPQPKSRDKPFTPGYVQDRADEAWTAAKLARVTLHECRHGYRSFLDAAGISEARADRYLGHASTSVGRRYTHAIDGQLAEDAKRLEEYLIGAAAGKVVSLATGARTGAQKTATA